MSISVPAHYRVVVRRDPEDARFWLADVDGLDGAHTSSRSLASLDRYVREVIVLAADLPDDAEAGLILTWGYRTGDAVADQQTEEVRQRRSELDEAIRAPAGQTAELARRLVTQDGFSIREAAALLSTSPARIDQMVQEPKKAKNAAA
jgi:hypothetical protein